MDYVLVLGIYIGQSFVGEHNPSSDRIMSEARADNVDRIF